MTMTTAMDDERLDETFAALANTTRRAILARLAEGDSAEPDSTLQSALRLLAAYIPSEALAVYIAVLGLLNPSPTATGQDVMIVRLICLVIGVVVAVSLPVVTFTAGGIATPGR